MARFLLVLAAVLCFLVAAALDFGWPTDPGPHALGWVGLGLAFYALAALLAAPHPFRVVRQER